MTRITFERRFTPGREPASAELQPGETLLGQPGDGAGDRRRGQRQRLQGRVRHRGDDPGLRLQGCRRRKVRGERRQGDSHGREGVMTILVYGHAEHVV